VTSGERLPLGTSFGQLVSYPLVTVRNPRQRVGKKSSSLVTFMHSDLRYALRQLCNNPGFTAIAVLTLALGIGSGTAVFSVVNAVLLKPLPFSEPDRLVRVYEARPPGNKTFAVSVANFLSWQEENRSFDGMAAFRSYSFTLLGFDPPERLAGAKVTVNFLSLLGVHPVWGRGFLPEDGETQNPSVVLVSHGLWQRRFGSATDIAGKTISLDGATHSIVGVLPPGFQFPAEAGELSQSEVELLAPVRFSPEQRMNRSDRYNRVVARLKDDVTLEQARSDMEGIASRLEESFPNSNRNWKVQVFSLDDRILGTTRRAVLILFGAVGLVLLITCANIANLLLARGVARQQEFAIRVALGCRKGRIIRQLLMENLILALLAGSVGVLFASWGLELLMVLAPEDIPRLSEVSLDGTALAFTLGLSVLTSLLSGLPPALSAVNLQFNDILKAGGRSGLGVSRARLQHLLICGETALSVLLLVGAGLLIASFVRLVKVNPGFRTENVLTAGLVLLSQKYESAQRRAQFFHEVLQRVAKLPGVRSAAGSTFPPFVWGDLVFSFRVEGRPPVQPGQRPRANFYSISSSYFQTLGIPLVGGRLFDEHDSRGGASVVIVNETLARRHFPNGSPVGQRILGGWSDGSSQIVGVVGDTKHYALDSDTTEQVYVPFHQATAESMTLVLRADGDPAKLAAALRNEVLAVDPEQPVSDIKTLQQAVSGSVARQRFSAALLGFFASLALVLAAAGIYAVTAYSVSQRTQELGLRMALGADSRDIISLVLKRGLALTVAGLAAGLLGAGALTRLLNALLFETSPLDVSTFLGATLVILAVHLLACYVPARRATKVDPMVALRCE